MKIHYINDYKDIQAKEDCVLVLGYFDGLHLGHKALFDKAKKIATEKNLKIVVLTFNETPRLTFARFQPELLLHLTSPEKRSEKFQEYGVDELYLMNFTSHFSKVSSDLFIKKYIYGLRAKAAVVGFDYKFGHNRTSGDYLARNFKGPVYIIDEISEGGEKISSTRIRQLITEGNVEKANQLLGYEFSTCGMVVHGDARGRTIGFPTANLTPINRTYLPADGVYISNVLINGKYYRAMTSIGKNITFGGTELRLEANIFDFDGDIYGETIEIFWLKRIREMVKFNGIDDLVKQLKKDKEIALNWKKDSQTL